MKTLTRTKIICTIGPKSKNDEVLRSLMRAGVSIFRLNFSHGMQSEHSDVIKKIRKISAELQTVVTICLDTKGYEFRIELEASSEMNVKTGDVISFSNKRGQEQVFVPIADFSSLSVGYAFYLDDGFLEMEVVEANGTILKGRAINNHRLKNKKKANFPGMLLKSSTSMCDDKNDVEFGIQNDVDIIFASFINFAGDVTKLQGYAKNNGIPIYSKIETLKGLENIDEILAVSDGIMVARGDLCVETHYSELFSAQKMLCKKARECEKPLICATQMLESMTVSTMPLRSEISDIGNAVLDECDAVMLSAETAVGQNSVLSALAMQKIIINAEEYQIKQNGNRKCPFINYDLKTCCLMEISNKRQLNYICKKRLRFPIFIYSHNKKLLSIGNMFKGLHPLQETDELSILAKKLKELYKFDVVYQIKYDEELDSLNHLSLV